MPTIGRGGRGGRGGRAPRGPRGTNATRPYGSGHPGADRIYTNGAILTLSPGRPRAEALATKGSRILAVGTRDEALRHRGVATEVVDLKGRALLPGFVDAHARLGARAWPFDLPEAARPGGEVEAQEALVALQLCAARLGVTTAGCGRPSAALLALLARADAERRLLLDVVAHPTSLEAALEARRLPGSARAGARVRIGGVALPVDGGPGCAGRIEAAYAANVQILGECPDDAAAAAFVEAIAAARRIHGVRDARPVLLHAGSLPGDLLAAMETLDIAPSLAVLPGAAGRAAYAAAVRRGTLRGAPAATSSPLQLVQAAVNAACGGPVPQDPGEGPTPLDALRAVTVSGARLLFEEADKGTLEVGKRADLVVLSDNPLSADPRSIADLQVVETIKDGETIFDAQAPPGRWPLRANDPERRSIPSAVCRS